MSDLGRTISVNAVQFERILPGPAERVWAHLTECDKLEGWYGENGTIEPREGGLIQFMGTHIRGVVTQWKPPRRLAYTWNVFEPDDIESKYPESYLSFELVPHGDEVRLTLFHLPVPERFVKQTMMGWHTFLEMLGAATRGQSTEPREAYWRRNAPLYGVDLDNLER